MIQAIAAIAIGAVLLAGCKDVPGNSPIATPAPTSTPIELVGTLNPAVTQTTIGRTICVSGWTTRIRPPASYTSGLERSQIRKLKLPGTPADYEEDHLMPLALGGAPRDPANLRPVPLKRAHEDDVLETRLHRLVCAGTLTLVAAQQRMSQVKAGLR